MEKITLVCEENSVRIDKYINIDGITRAAVQKMIENGSITVNGNHTKNNYKLKSGDVIEIIPEEPQDANICAEDIPIDIVYEDDDLLVVNKPQGMVVHPAPGNYSGTLVNALMYHCKDGLSGINGVLRPGIVHRIDKDTSGLLVIAKNDEAHLNLSEQFKVHSITRVYTAVVNGRFKENSGSIDAPIGRHPVNRKKMAVTDKNSKNAVTHFEVLEEYGKYSLIRCRLETGRTHQIRVHMSFIGHPLLGDLMYGDKNKMGLAGQILHAGVLGFNHPKTGKYVEFKSELPQKFSEVVQSLRDSSV